MQWTAGFCLGFHIGRRWSAASDVHRYLAMKALALLLLGSLSTTVLLALLLLMFRPCFQRQLPAYWVGLVSALAWLPAFVFPPIRASLAKDPMSVFDWVIA